MNRKTWYLGIITALIGAGCSENSEMEATSVKQDKPQAVAQFEGAAEVASAGFASFAVDGSEKRFESFAGGGNYYGKIASTVVARPAAGATAMLQITFVSMDLKSQDYPAELPVPVDTSKPFNPATVGATIGFIYMDEDGVEWAGPGTVHVESFDSNGVLTGTFNDVSLPHIDEERANVLLSSGSFQAKITRGW